MKKNFYFIFKGPTTVQVQAAPAGADPQNEAWKAAQESASVDGYQAYLESYPKGRYAAAARVKLADLRKAAKLNGPAAPPPASVAVEDGETSFWNEVKASGAKEYFDAYLKQYPRGKYVALARIEVKKLDDREREQRLREGAEKQQAAERERQEAQRAEQSVWDEAKAAASTAAYASYLERYPKGRYAALAQAAQQKLQREAGEREKQDAAQRRQEEERQRAESEKQRLAAQRERREAQKAAGDLRPGKVVRDCADCPEMVVIPAGSFEMGGGTYPDEKPVHRVTLRSFAIGRTEVTHGQWRAVMGNNPSRFSTCGDDCPVESVSWNDAQEFVRKLNQKTGKIYRLPSEAEWEYACRSGGKQEYCGGEGIDSVGWYAGNSGSKTHSVAGKQANAWGLYDMSGNVWEWTQDCWNESYTGAPGDGSAWTSGDCGQRVLRGGSWNGKPQYARAAIRSGTGTAERSLSNGFRLARMLP